MIERVGNEFRVAIGPAEQRVVLQSLDELRGLLAEHDPATKRLFPAAYVEQPELEIEYRRLVGDDLLRSQLESIAVVERTIDGTPVDRGGLEAWMRALNSVRLALGTSLDISEDLDLEAIDPHDPDLHRYALYEFLTVLIYFILQALQSDR